MRASRRNGAPPLACLESKARPSRDVQPGIRVRGGAAGSYGPCRTSDMPSCHHKPGAACAVPLSAQIEVKAGEDAGGIPRDGNGVSDLMTPGASVGAAMRFDIEPPSDN